jgi:hypothetical protein
MAACGFASSVSTDRAHAHVYRGGQAIVGNVNQGGGDAKEISGQSLGSGLALATGPAMYGDLKAIEAALPSAGGPRQEGVRRFHDARAGAPRGKRNGVYRHGHYTAEAVASRQAVRAVVREAKATLSALECK